MLHTDDAKKGDANVTTKSDFLKDSEPLVDKTDVWNVECQFIFEKFVVCCYLSLGKLNR